MNKLETNKIYCLDILDGLSKLDDNCIDLIITSPPYNIGIKYDCWNDRMNWNEYFKWCEKWLKELYRVLKKDGRFALNHYFSLGSGKRGLDIGRKKGTNQIEDNNRNGGRVAPLMKLNEIACEKIGFKHHSVAVWMDITLSRKTAWGSWLSASSPYINSPFEGILFLYKESWKKENKGESTIDKKEFIDLTRGIWHIRTQSKQFTKANFHFDLPSKCIRLLSYKGDLILDPFMGSGTTSLACKTLERNFIGFEISPQYVKIANKRISKVQKSLFL